MTVQDKYNYAVKKTGYETQRFQLTWLLDNNHITKEDYLKLEKLVRFRVKDNILVISIIYKILTKNDPLR